MVLNLDHQEKLPRLETIKRQDLLDHLKNQKPLDHPEKAAITTMAIRILHQTLTLTLILILIPNQNDKITRNRITIIMKQNLKWLKFLVVNHLHLKSKIQQDKIALKRFYYTKFKRLCRIRI